MKVKEMIVCALLILSSAAPALAYSNWVEDFLRSYDPSKSEPARPGQSAADLAQLLQTGVVPITMNDVVNMIVEAFWGHRVSAKTELAGLDIPEMGALGYPEFALKPEPVLAEV